jgi:hypothetical protein
MVAAERQKSGNCRKKCGNAEGKLKNPGAYFATAEYFWLR